MKLISFFREVYHRFTLPSPSFFRQLQKFGIWLSGISLTQLAVKEKMPNIAFPEFINTFCNYASVMGLVILFISKLTVSSADDLEKKMTNQ